MRKKGLYIIIIVILLFVGLVISFIIYYSNIPYYKVAQEHKNLINVPYVNNDTIKIAYIGDSWAALHKSVPNILETSLVSITGKSVRVKYAGIGGLTSKFIYESFFMNTEMKNVIEWGPNFCFVSAGINDSNRKMGSGFYKDNMRLIISMLLRQSIIPVILEIPNYDIHFTFTHMYFPNKLRALRSMLWTCSPIDCIENYVAAYDNMIDEMNWQDKVITIRKKQWNPDGYRDKRGLYLEDRMHLNEKGYYYLDSCIASEIAKWILIKDFRNSKKR